MQINNSDICFHWLGDIGIPKDAIWQHGYLPWKALHVITLQKCIKEKCCATKASAFLEI